MTSSQHEDLFLKFAKQHPLLEHVTYSINKPTEQKIIGLIEINDDHGSSDICPLASYGELPNSVLIDPDYTAIYNDFINLDFMTESVSYIKNLVESKTTDAELNALVENLLVKKIIDSNISAKNVYVRVMIPGDTSYCHRIMRV